MVERQEHRHASCPRGLQRTRRRDERSTVAESAELTPETPRHKTVEARFDSTTPAPAHISRGDDSPYLDCMSAPDVASVRQAKALPWLHSAESNTVSWIIENESPNYLTAMQARRRAELDKQRGLVEARLKYELERLLSEAGAAAERENLGEKLKESSESLSRKATDLQTRLDLRLELIDQQGKCPPNRR